MASSASSPLRPASLMARVVLSVLAASQVSGAQISMPQIFGDGMVMQTNNNYGARSFMYGEGSPGETISITGIPRRSGTGPYTTVVSPQGQWIVQLDPVGHSLLPVSYTASVSGSVSPNTLTFRDVVFGDVFVCSGQSNMAFSMAGIANASAEIAAANSTMIRLFTVPRSLAATPQRTFNASAAVQPLRWLNTTSSTVRDFSAVCYLTGRDIMRMQVKGAYHVGLIHASVGGTGVSLWSPPAVFEACDAAFPSSDPRRGQLFNGMIAPLVGYSVKAALWYQGEHDSTNEPDTAAYGCRFGNMINSWRDLWGMGDFSFLFVQLAPYDHSTTFPALRLQQATALPHPGSLVDTAGMAVVTDLGTPATVHPTHKAEVGRRLALQAVHVAYAMQTLDGSQVPYDGFADGPVLLEATRGTGGVTLRYGNAGGLHLRGTLSCNVCCGGASRTFEYSSDPWGPNATWTGVPAGSVSVAGSSITLAGVPSHAEAVRTNYEGYPECVPSNDNGLVAQPAVINVTAPAADSQSSTAPASTQSRSFGGPGHVAVTPPMGFNSWNYYHCNVDERALKQIAQKLIDTGLAGLGYRYVNIDDCWQVARQPNGTIVPDPVRFPSGLRAIADWLHERDMLFGIYTAAHGSTCQGRPGSYLMEAIDSATYCGYGIDYLKIDQCGGDSYEHHHKNKNLSWIKFQAGFQKCLAETGRPVVQSVESCGTVAGCGEWIADCSNLWRTGSDLEDSWGSIMHNLDQTAPLYPLAGIGKDGNGHWNDPDMLEVGNVGITDTEARSHFALWCILAAPLLIGTDIATASNATLAILGAKELIGVDQDPLGFQGRVVADSAPRGPESGRVQVYGKKMADGSVAALLLNRGDGSASIAVDFGDVWLSTSASVHVRDLWAERDVGLFHGSYNATVPSHGTVVVRLTQQ